MCTQTQVQSYNTKKHIYNNSKEYKDLINAFICRQCTSPLLYTHILITLATLVTHLYNPPQQQCASLSAYELTSLRFRV